MRISAIDIGTNTILMLIADVQADGSLKVVRDEHTIARLGKGVDSAKNILPETFQRALTILTKLKSISDEAGSQHIVACGTSALRDAVNRDEFIEFIRAKVGITIHVLNGDEEAQLTYWGGASEYFHRDPEQSFAVLDIGGGSTELVEGKGKFVSKKCSLNVGAVRMTERFLHSSPPTTSEIRNAQTEIEKHLTSSFLLSESAQLVGVAGTVTTLAAMDLKLSAYAPEKIHGYHLQRARIDYFYDQLKILPLERIHAIPQILPMRADIILAGIMILRTVMQKNNLKEIIVSDRGLRYGLLFAEADRVK
ncbi:MAG TPA: Ppx/GppA phosphatase family protein [Bacteroidota bacterium]|nr:Ppx/GppA phosphatase family protein [Bacteroidota bacterium]